MKLADIEKILAAGLITAEQRDQIVERFKLREEGSKFLVILSIVGAALVVSGIVLLISANWNDIPRFVKLAVGLLLMVGAHAGGYYLREVRQKYAKTGEALYLIGSVMFLANIALVGQIYHLSSRPPNAILLWWVGIAGLPWLLRSKTQHILALLAFSLWFSMEANEPTGWMHQGGESQILFYALLGLIFLGFGYCLRSNSFREFAPATENLGLLGSQIMLWLLTTPIGRFARPERQGSTATLFVILAVLALGLIGIGLRHNTQLTQQWRWTWFGLLAATVGFLATILWIPGFGHQTNYWAANLSPAQGVASILVFVLCLAQIQVGLQERSAFVVNLGIVGLATDIIITYLVLLGSMAQTGLMFVVSGVFLIGLGIYLEKKRRGLMRQINTPTNSPTN